MKAERHVNDRPSSATRNIVASCSLSWLMSQAQRRYSYGRMSLLNDKRLTCGKRTRLQVFKQQVCLAQQQFDAVVDRRGASRLDRRPPPSVTTRFAPPTKLISARLLYRRRVTDCPTLLTMQSSSNCTVGDGGRPRRRLFPTADINVVRNSKTAVNRIIIVAQPRTGANRNRPPFSALCPAVVTVVDYKNLRRE